MEENLNKLDCTQINAKIEILTNLISTYSILAIKDTKVNAQILVWKKLLNDIKVDYDINGCSLKLEAIRQQDIEKIDIKYKEIDETRITTGTSYEVKKRLFYGGMVLLTALGIMLIIGKQKK